MVRLALFFAIALSTACAPMVRRPLLTGVPVLYVGSGDRTIQVFTATIPAGQTIPQLVAQPAVTVANGVPSALKVVGSSLYVAKDSGEMDQYSIDRNGSPTLRGSVAINGTAPYAMTATDKNLYVANLGSSDISVFSIDAGGNLAWLQTFPYQNLSAIAIDGPQSVLFLGQHDTYTGGRPTSDDALTPLCVQGVQADGTIVATMNQCSQYFYGTAIDVEFTQGRLYILSHLITVVSEYFPLFTSTFSNFMNDSSDQYMLDLEFLGDNNLPEAKAIALSPDAASLFEPGFGAFNTVDTASGQAVASGLSVPSNTGCAWPPKAPSAITADSRGHALYMIDTLGTTSVIYDRDGTPHPIPQPSITTLQIDPTTHTVAPVRCNMLGRLPTNIAMHMPSASIRLTR
jgi:hypothetical protein